MVLKYLGVSLLSICLLTACQNDKPTDTQAKEAQASTEQTDKAPATPDAQEEAKQDESNTQDERLLLLDEPNDGRKTYYIPDSIKESDEGLIAVLVEMTQKPEPAENTALVRQRMIVDCERKLTAPVNVGLFDSQGNKLEEEDFEYPDYTTFSKDELKNAQDNVDEASVELIKKVCKPS